MSIKDMGKNSWKDEYQDIQSPTTQAYIGLMLVQSVPFLPDDITRKIIDVLNSTHMRVYLLHQWFNINSIGIDPRPKCEKNNHIYEYWFDIKNWEWILTRNETNPLMCEKYLNSDSPKPSYFRTYEMIVRKQEDIFHDNFIRHEHIRVLKNRKEVEENMKCQNSLVRSQQKELKRALKQMNKHSQKPQNVNRR
jgi:hypothetical protein